jgi:hypothetical protein
MRVEGKGSSSELPRQWPKILHEGEEGFGEET